MRGVAWLFAVVAVAGAVVWLMVARRSDAGSERLLADLSADIERGSLADLGRAQAVGRRMAFDNPHDREAASRWAFASAALAADYGLDTSRETADALARVGSSGAPDNASVIAASARALDLLHAGDREAAGRLAAETAGAASDMPHPLYALGRARARNGDLPGAARALEAAMIRAPGFAAARVAWAEVQLDLGDAKAARTALQTLREQSPNDARVALLLNEAEIALGVLETPLPFTGCPIDRLRPPAIYAACMIGGARRARRGGDRLPARSLAEDAAKRVPDEPRLLARTALVLSQLGAVDRAAALLERARRLTAPGTPTLAWATAAVSLGRGNVGALPAGARPADPELPLLIVRASLAAGGVGALSSAIDELGAGAPAHDADLAELADLRPKSPYPTRTLADDPVHAYVAGLRARLDGKLEVAADRLRHALAGHGDACRAAGEYRATLRAFKQKPEAAAFLDLRQENAGCVNLPKVP